MSREHAFMMIQVLGSEGREKLDTPSWIMLIDNLLHFTQNSAYTRNLAITCGRLAIANYGSLSIQGYQMCTTHRMSKQPVSPQETPPNYIQYNNNNNTHTHYWREHTQEGGGLGMDIIIYTQALSSLGWVLCPL